LNCCDSWECRHCVNGTCQPCLRKAATYAELQECSHVVDDPATEPVPNGCSLPYILSRLTGIDPDNPTGCPDTSFLGPCNAHDECYQTCGRNKDNCDDDFLGEVEPPSGMLGICAGSSCAYRCSSFYATAYYNAVCDHGLTAWQNDQVIACACCDCN
jgi:hypothetical protein